MPDRVIDRRVIPIKEEKVDDAPEEVGFRPIEQDTEIYKQRFFPTTSRRDSLALSQTYDVSNTVTTVANTTDQTVLVSVPILASEFRLARAIRITANGVYSTVDATPTVTIRVGSSVAAETAGSVASGSFTEINSMASTAAAVTNAPWNLVWYGIVATTGSSGTTEAQMVGKINNVNKDDPNTATVTVSTVVQQDLAITAQWSAANASNTLSIRQFILEVVY